VVLPNSRLTVFTFAFATLVSGEPWQTTHHELGPGDFHPAADLIPGSQNPTPENFMPARQVCLMSNQIG